MEKTCETCGNRTGPVCSDCPDENGKVGMITECSPTASCENWEYNKFEEINLVKTKLPKDYHCRCEFCKQFLGVLKRENGTYYNKLDRHYYYVDAGKHVAKTPMHLARYLIQTYSKPGDWILDPTIGAGTTAVEAINHDRRVCGMELDYDFYHLVLKNIRNNRKKDSQYHIGLGDARDISPFLKELKKEDGLSYRLIINNPPYAADVCEHHTTWDVRDGRKPANTRVYNYHKKYDGKNLAKIKRDEEYYKVIRGIYASCIPYLKPGGYFCIGVKDMIRKQEPYLLHYYLGCILAATPCNLNYQGMILLPHYPTTIFMRTYPKKYPKVKIPLYQTILVFQKPGNKM